MELFILVFAGCFGCYWIGYWRGFWRGVKDTERKNKSTDHYEGKDAI
jgi:hypothetical protein